MPKKILISVVIPVYLGELLVEVLVQRIITALQKITDNYEIILVNDGSPDDTWKKIKEISSGNIRIIGIDLARNYGQHRAIKTGLENCSGEWDVVMDCDLQDEPEDIVNLYNSIRETSDSVFALRMKGNTGAIKRFFSWFFYVVLELFTGIKFKGRVTNFGIYHNTLISRAIQIPKKYFFFPLAVRLVSDHSEHLLVNHNPRISGKTSYSFFKALNLAFVILAGNSFLSFLLKKRNDKNIIKEIINPAT